MKITRVPALSCPECKSIRVSVNPLRCADCGHGTVKPGEVWELRSGIYGKGYNPKRDTLDWFEHTEKEPPT